MSKVLTNETQQRGLKDFLTVYNMITEYCFDKCVSKFNERAASQNEASCVDTCAVKYVNYNQRFMFNFADHQGRRQREAERVAAEAAAKEHEEQQKHLQETAAAFAAGQEQAAADMAAAASASSSDVAPNVPLKTAQAAQLLESLASAGSAVPSPTVNPLQSNSEPVSVAASPTAGQGAEKYK